MRERNGWNISSNCWSSQEVFFLTVMTLRLIRGRKPKSQIPQTPGVYRKNLPQPDTIPVPDSFREPLLNQTGGVLPPQYVCALLTLENWEGLKSPSGWRKTKRGCCLDPSQQPQELAETQSEVFHAVGTQSIMSCCSPVPAQPEVHHKHEPGLK